VTLFVTAAVAFAGFVIYELRFAAAPMADLRLFARRSFAATGFVAFAISATVIGMILYLSLFVQNTLGYSPVQAGLRFLPLSLASFAAALVTGRLIGKVPMRVLLGVAMVAAAVGLASMAHLTATSTWLVLVPGFSWPGSDWASPSTALASAALAAVEPARAGMAAGLVNTLRQVGTATGVAVLGALYASRVNQCHPARFGRRARLRRASYNGWRPLLPPARAPGWPTWSRRSLGRRRSRGPRRHRERAQRCPARRGCVRRPRRDSGFRLRTRPGRQAPPSAATDEPSARPT
jgi:hypothetical protein